MQEVDENRRVEGALEQTVRFVVARPNDFGAASVKAWKHDPDCRIQIQSGESLHAKAGQRQIGKACIEPVSPLAPQFDVHQRVRSEEHTSELQSLMRTSYAVFCLTKKNQIQRTRHVLY